MRDYIIMTDSSCDLPPKLADELNITVVPLTVILDGNTYRNYLDEREIKMADFYKEMKAGKIGTTSAVNMDEFEQAMREHLETDKDILYLGFSSGLSVTYQAATMAKDELLESFPKANIITVDTLAAAMGQGLLVYLAAKEKEKGKTIEEVASFVESMKGSIAHHFTVNDLTHLKRGGRISATAALLGSALNIKPMLRLNEEGVLVPESKVRGRKQAIKSLLESVKTNGKNLDEIPVFISEGDCLEDAKMLEAMIREQTNAKEVMINQVGPVIGAHTGPGIMGVFFYSTKR